MPKGRTPHVLVRFGAVDYAAEIYVNGHRAGAHEGAYTPFSVDVADFVRSGTNEVLVRVVDPPPTAQGASPRFPDMPYEELPRGKQNWYIENGGLWQPVTLDVRQSLYVEHVHVSAKIDGTVNVDVEVNGANRAAPGDDQGVDSGAGRVHRRRTASRAGVEGRSAAHDRRREVAAVVVALRASPLHRDDVAVRTIHRQGHRSVRLPRVHRARRAVLPERRAVLHARGARPGLLPGFHLQHPGQGVRRRCDDEGTQARAQPAALPHQGLRPDVPRRGRRGRACWCGTRCRAGTAGPTSRWRAARRSSTTWWRATGITRRS